jgi:hypothetical protein
MNAELEELKERKRLYLNWVYKIDDQIAELENHKPWEPKGGDWCVFVDGKVLDGDSESLVRLFGAERPTKGQAEQAAVAMRRFNRLLAYRDEFAPGYIFQRGGMNYYVYANDRDWFVESVSVKLAPAQVYFPMDVADELCRKLNSGEVIL